MAELTLFGLWRDVRHRWVLAVAIAAATLLGGYIYAQSLPNVYRARVVVAFSPKSNSSIGGDTLRVSADVARVTGMRVVGTVPPSRSARGRALDAVHDPEVGAAIRTIRTNLERLSREQPVHVVVVTSSIAGEGKTTISSLLAIT